MSLPPHLLPCATNAVDDPDLHIWHWLDAYPSANLPVRQGRHTVAALVLLNVPVLQGQIKASQ